MKKILKINLRPELPYTNVIKDFWLPLSAVSDKKLTSRFNRKKNTNAAQLQMETEASITWCTPNKITAAIIARMTNRTRNCFMRRINCGAKVNLSHPLNKYSILIYPFLHER
jgi:hypothetical protein